MTDRDVRSLIESEDVDGAVHRALTLRVRDVTEQLDYETLEEHAEDGSAFLQQWVPSLDPGERLQAAAWASGQYITAIVHVEGAYGIGARLLLEAQRAAAAELAATMRDIAALTYRSGRRGHAVGRAAARRVRRPARGHGLRALVTRRALGVRSAPPGRDRGRDALALLTLALIGLLPSCAADPPGPGLRLLRLSVRSSTGIRHVNRCGSPWWTAVSTTRTRRCQEQ